MKISKLSIEDVLDNSVATLIMIKPEDLKQTIINVVDEARRRMEKEIALNNSEVLLTTKQVTERLSISRTTLWHWGKKGYVIPVVIGGKQRYKLSDVNTILQGKNEVFREA